MPAYFFDIHDGDHLTVDREGVTFPNDEDARDAAIRLLAAIAKDQLPDGSEHTFWVKIRSADGADIFTASLDLKTQWLKRRA